ncbi:MAG: tetratricopeptide repeat protein, partial [Gemmatimonadota bacterium]|nr:tetratricopeptide repeat protein [Gemmatimonadota bacterium]
ILRAGMIPAGAELSSVDIERATTSSVEALRAFLEGEVDYRRARFRDAIAHFNDAVEIDPAFPLALYRLGLAHSWEGRPELGREFAERALAHADRLPDREALLLEGFHRLADRDDAAIQTLEEYTRRYPDDVEGWHLLGDAYYHIGAPRLVPLRRFREAAREAIERNPYFGPPYLHLIDHAFHRRDEKAVLELVDKYAEIDRDTDWCIGYDVAAGLAYGDSARRRTTLAALDTVSADPLSCASRALVMTPATWASYEVVWDEHLSRGTFAAPVRADARFWRGEGLRQRGRIREAVGLREELLSGQPASANIRYDLLWYLAGYEDDRIRAWAERLERAEDKGVRGHVLLALLAGDEGRPEEAEEHVRALRALADSLGAVSDTARLEGRTAKDISTMADATLAALDLRRDLDDPGALESAREALFDLSTTNPVLMEILRYDVGRGLVARGRFEEARPYFESFSWESRWYTTPKEYWLGRVHEGLGHVEEARRHYGNFVTWWEDADPPFHAWREEAR